jgi:hypothetical protein
MALELRSYQKKTKSIEVELTGEEKLKVEYLPSYLNMEAIAVFESEAQASSEGTDLKGMYDSYVSHLSKALASVDITLDKKPVPFGTEDEKKETLRLLSYHDLQAINRAVNKDLQAPFE